MSALVVTLPGLPPTVNHAYEGNQRGGRKLTQEAQDWRDGVTTAVRIMARAAGWTLPPKTPWRLTVVFMAPDLYKWDVDNRAKVLIDALQAAFGGDDRYLVRHHATKVYGPDAQTWLLVDLASDREVR